MLNYCLLGDIGPLIPYVSKNIITNITPKFYSNELVIANNGDYYACFPDSQNNKYQYIVGFTADDNIKWMLKVTGLNTDASEVHNRFASIILSPNEDKLILTGNSNYKANTSGVSTSSLALLILDTDGNIIQNRTWNSTSQPSYAFCYGLSFIEGNFLYIPTQIRNSNNVYMSVTKVNLSNYAITANLWNAILQLSALANGISGHFVGITGGNGQITQFTDNATNSITLKQISSTNSFLYISKLYDNKYFVASSSTKQLLCISASNLSIIWNKQFSAPLYFPTVSDGFLYVNYNTDAVLKLDLEGNVISAIYSKDVVSVFDIRNNKFVGESPTINGIISFDASRLTTSKRNRVFRLTDLSQFQSTNLSNTYYSSVSNSYIGTADFNESSPVTIENIDPIINRIK